MYKNQLPLQCFLLPDGVSEFVQELPLRLLPRADDVFLGHGIQDEIVHLQHHLPRHLRFGSGRKPPRWSVLHESVLSRRSVLPPEHLIQRPVPPERPELASVVVHQPEILDAYAEDGRVEDGCLLVDVSGTEVFQQGIVPHQMARSHGNVVVVAAAGGRRFVVLLLEVAVLGGTEDRRSPPVQFCPGGSSFGRALGDEDELLGVRGGSDHQRGSYVLGQRVGVDGCDRVGAAWKFFLKFYSEKLMCCFVLYK